VQSYRYSPPEVVSLAKLICTTVATAAGSLHSTFRYVPAGLGFRA
jgi:hypothetical protein